MASLKTAPVCRKIKTDRGVHSVHRFRYTVLSLRLISLEVAFRPEARVLE